MPAARHRRATCLALAVLAAAVAMVLPGAPRAEAQQAPLPTWTYRALAPLPGTTAAEVHDVNAAGWAVGHSQFKPTLWTPGGTPIALPLPAEPGATHGIARAINEWGFIVGEVMSTVPSFQQGLGWLAGQVFTLGPRFGATDVNERGDVVGCHRGNSHPLVKPVGQPIVGLPVPHPGGGCPRSINDWGAIGGTVAPEEPLTESWDAALWYQGQRFDLSTVEPGLRTVEAVTNHPYALAETAGIPTERTDAVLLIGDDVLPLAPDAASSQGTDINASGHAVGLRQLAADGPLQPVLWVYGATVPLTDLTTADDAVGPGTPVAISDRAWIVGNTGNFAWVLHPGPAPGTLPSTGAAPG